MVYLQTVMNIDSDEFDEFTPEGVAKALFTKEPGLPRSNEMNLTQSEGVKHTHIFEILCIILLEGMEALTGNLKHVDLEHFTENHISELNPWFKSLGFEIKVTMYNLEDVQSYNNYYCRIILNRDKYCTFFQKKYMDNKSYHFLLNGEYLEENRLKEFKDLHAVFQNENTVYKICFDNCYD